jgi:AcrR family transcriptional regulator
MTVKKSARERILQASFELLSEKGFAGSCTKEIAQRAGVAEVTLFRHFTNKENLFRQTTQRNSSVPALETVIPTILDKPINEGIPILVDAFLTRMSDNKSWIRIFQMELQRDPEVFRPECQRLLDELYRVCGSYFSQVVRNGSSICCDPLLAAKVFVMLCYGFFQVEEIQLGNSWRSVDNQPVVDAIIKMLCKGMETEL